MEKTAELPLLQLLYSCLDKVVHTPAVCNDICLVVQSAVNCDGCAVAVLTSCSWDFFGCCTQVQGWGRVHWDTAPKIRCTC